MANDIQSTSEPITWQKFLGGIGNIKNFIKLGSSGINILLIIFFICGGLFLWNKFFPKKSVTTQKQTSSITFGKGAEVDNVTIINKQEDVKKRIVGLQISSTSKDAGIGLVKWLNDSWSVVVGGRWSYEKPDDGSSQVLPEIKVQYDMW
jgi:hypothetical protein